MFKITSTSTIKIIKIKMTYKIKCKNNFNKMKNLNKMKKIILYSLNKMGSKSNNNKCSNKN